MPNQYTKVPVNIHIQKPNDMTYLNKCYTKAIFEIIKNKIPHNPSLIDEVIQRLISN